MRYEGYNRREIAAHFNIEIVEAKEWELGLKDILIEFKKMSKESEFSFNQVIKRW